VDESSEAAAIPRLELVRRVLEFANTGEPKALPGARAVTVGGRTFWVSTPEEDVQHTHEVLRNDLTAIVKGELSGHAVARLRKQARYVTVRRYTLERGVPRPVDRQFVKNLAPVLADVLLQVRGEAALRSDVRQCRLPACGRFFLASDQIKNATGVGRRRYKYCSDEHMDLGQTPGSIRTARWRKNSNKPATKHK
jgi:hypothetical protein